MLTGFKLKELKSQEEIRITFQQMLNLFSSFITKLALQKWFPVTCKTNIILSTPYIYATSFTIETYQNYSSYLLKYQNLKLWFKVMLSNLRKINFKVLFKTSINYQSFSAYSPPTPNMQFRSLCFANRYGAKISKKQKQKSEKMKEKAKTKQQLGDTSTVDLEELEQKFKTILDDFKQASNQIKIGKLDQQFFNDITIKISKQNYKIVQLCQIAPKTVTTCILTPYDVDNLNQIQKELISLQIGIEIKKVEKMLVLTMNPESVSSVKKRFLEKLKKLHSIKKQKINKQRTTMRDSLKKMKKIVQENRLRTIQEEVKVIYEKYNDLLDNMFKKKEKELK